MTKTSSTSKSFLQYFNMSDHYERKARFVPALLTIATFLPAAFVLGLPLYDWLTVVIAGVGLGAVFAVGLSHLASAMGNRYQSTLWPRWPHDSPTNRWLHPSDASRSTQQKDLWCASILCLTGLDIAAVPPDQSGEVEAVINDAVAQVRNLLWKSPCADRLRLHNADYGFARNVAGLSPLWITGCVLSSLATWIAFVVGTTNIGWPLVTTALAVGSILLAVFVLPAFVRTKANFYAESFFAAAVSLDQNSSSVMNGIDT
jgi:hypothetical protein